MQECAPDSERHPLAATATGQGENQKADAERTDGEILLVIADLISGGGAGPDLFKKLVSPLRELTNCDVISFALYDATQNRIVTDFWKQGHETGLGKSFSVDESPSGWVWQHQEPLIVPELERETRFANAVHELQDLGVCSYTILPISTSKHRYGALGIGGNRAAALSPPKLRSLKCAARLVGLAVENHEIRSQWEKQQTRLQSLVAISRDLSTVDIEQLLPMVFASTRQITNHDYARLALLEADRRWLQVRGVDPVLKDGPRLHKDQRIPIERAISARAIETRRIVFHSA